MNSLAERAKVKREVIRRCAVTRVSRPENELLRFVADADGVIRFDIKRKLPGRGVWITASKATVGEAVKRNMFQRSLRRNVTVPRELPDEVEQALERAALGALALANKAGQVTAGFAKVAAALEKNRLVGLVHSAEAAEDGCRRLNNRFAAAEGAGEAPSQRIFRFSCAALSQTLGRENVNHAGLLHGGASRSFIAAAQRLCHFTQDPTAQGGGPSKAETFAGNLEPAIQDTE